MDIKTLESFKLSDAVKFHNQLNPKIWRNQHLRPEVKQQLMIIAKDFMEELGVNDLNVKDLTVSGSNAAYSYTPHSDLDLHILVDMSKLPNDSIYRELFNAKKTIYNDSHEITVHGVPVELYVQDSNEPVVSLGEYSLKDNKWLRIPTKRRANFDQTASKSKYEKMLKLIEMTLKTENLDKVLNVLKTIKRYRQAGLDEGGEFSPENLAYKALRSQGYITKLYDLRDKLHSKKLSVEGMYTSEGKEQYKTNKLAKQFSRELKINEAFDKPYPFTWEKSDFGDWDALATLGDGTYLSIMFENEGDEEWHVKFDRNYSMELTGEGDSQRVFATVLSAIQQFIKKEHPWRITFSAKQELEPGQYNPSRAKLYNRMVQRYANAWGYDEYYEDQGDLVVYELTRKKEAVAEASGYIPSEKEKNDPRFKTALTVDVKPNSIKKNAKSFYWDTNRAGIPPTLKPSGKV